MRYLSLFSGIGGFEVAIHQHASATCVGYSEIDKHAIAEYERHYPDHTNLGDVTNITKKDIDKLGKIDLIVGGFPCNDLSSANLSNRKGLDGDKSGLFWTMLKIIKWSLSNNPDLQIIIENNASMANKWRDIITSELTGLFKKQVYCNFFDSSKWVAQRRRRYYWTLKEIPDYKGKKLHTMSKTLDPVKTDFEYMTSTLINYFNKDPFKRAGNSFIVIDGGNGGESCEMKEVPYQTRWKTRSSSTQNNYIRCINTQTHDNTIFDYRMRKPNTFSVRYLTKRELNKCSGFPTNYVHNKSKTVYVKLYGMTVVPPVVLHIIKALDI